MTFRITVLALILVAAIVASGCEKKGPAEKAGEKIDRAYTEALEKAEEAGEKMEDAGEKIDEAIRKAEEAVEETGDAVKDD